MPKTTFTNADLDAPRRGERGFKEPQDIVGEWKFSNPADEQAQTAWLEGRDINEGASADSVLADAKAALQAFQQGHGNAVLRESARRPVEQPNRFTEFMRGAGPEMAPGALTLASTATGPIGGGAALLNAGLAGLDMADNGVGVGNTLNLGLSALAAKAGLQGMFKGARAAQGVRGEIPYRRTAEDIGDVMGRTPQKPLPVTRMPNATVTRAHADDIDILGGLDRNMPNTPNPRAGAASPFDAATYLQTNADDSASSVAALLDRYMPNTSGAVQAAPKAAESLAELSQTAGNTTRAALNAPAVGITDPSRLLPAFGETSATGKLAGQPSLKELVQRLVPGLKVKALKGYPNPSGKDATSKAIRQRGHIAKSYEHLSEDPR